MDRYALKEPYCLWVPSETPETPARVGHDMWFHTPEDESAPREMRVMYWLNDQCNKNASDVNMIVMDPALKEQLPPTPGDGTINTMYGGDDADQDGEPDGIKVYEFADDDPPGTWRCLWTAADACGPHSPHRRTHDKQRMLVANAREARWSFWLLLDPGHGKIYNKYDLPNTVFRGGKEGSYVEAEGVLHMARCAAAMPLGAFPHIGGISLSRSSTWDLGRNDADPQIGGAPSVGDEEPNGQRSLDNRVRWAKQEQADNWGNGHTQCLFVSLHTQGSGEPALRGVFRVLDPDQALKIPSSSLGASALAGPARELGWYSSSAYVRWEPIQVLHMVSKVLTEDTDRDGQAFKDTLQALEPDDPAMRGPMPAVLLELGHHSNTWHPLGDPNYFDLCDHRLRLRIGVGVVGGVDEWIKLNGPYWER